MMQMPFANLARLHQPGHFESEIILNFPICLSSSFKEKILQELMHWISYIQGELTASASAVRCGSSNADLVDAAAASAAAAPEEMPVPRDMDVDNEDVLDDILDELLHSPRVLDEDTLDGPAATTEYITANPWVGRPYPKAGPKKGTAQKRRAQKKRAAEMGRKSPWKLDADRALKQLKQMMRAGGTIHQFDKAKHKLVGLWAKTFLADGGPETVKCCQKAATAYVDELVKDVELDAASQKQKWGRMLRMSLQQQKCRRAQSSSRDFLNSEAAAVPDV